MGLFNALLGNAGSVEPASLQKEFGQLFLQGEEVEIGFKLVRDVFIFTNVRLILVDVQGLTGKKVEYLSLPYKSISRFSIETAGTFDLDAELKIWVSSEAAPSVQKKFNRSVNIYDLQRTLAYHVLSIGGPSKGFVVPSASSAAAPTPPPAQSDQVNDIPMR
ncbi:MAG: PH domain-containing protein [Flavobacteriales bacterium]|nr:PH domain-containing protein [Flavobacteriales bacterium]